jgi:hypothetical protein
VLQDAKIIVLVTGKFETASKRDIVIAKARNETEAAAYPRLFQLMTMTFYQAS